MPADAAMPSWTPSKFDSPKRSISLKLAVIARHLRQRFDERADQIGVTRAQWTLITTVARAPGATQRMIASSLEVTDVTAGRLIERLCAEGYLERRPHPQDRRAYCVFLTPAAQPVLDRLSAIAGDYEQETFASIADDDIARLDSLLETIAENLLKSRMATRTREVLEASRDARETGPA